MPDPEVKPPELNGEDAPVPAAPAPLVHSLSRPFNRSGAPSIADLGFDAQPDKDDEDDRKNKKSSGDDLIGFPGERVPHISFGFEGERWRIRNVVWVIGQSTTGQMMLDQTYRAGYRMGFDSMISTGERLECYTNLADKVITLDSRASTDQLVLMLTYCLALACSAIDGVSYDSSMHPPAALLAHRMANAYALGLQLQVCFELKTSPTLPEASDRETWWRMIAKEQSRLASAYAQSAISEMAVTQGSPMATVIREFYSYKPLLEHYDAEVINYFRSLPQSLLKDPRAMTSGFDPGAQSFKFKFPGMNYAVNHEPKLNLKDPAHMASSAAIAEAVAALLVIRRNAGVKDREPWHVQVV